ncbi:MAG TPA: cation:proton antiporter [Ktedonobacterales bacterium]
MTEELRLILDVTIALFAALIGGAVAHRLRQSVIVGYLIAGVLIASVAPGLIGNLANIRALAEIGIIFLMFALGIEFSLKELLRVKGVAVVGTLLQMSLLIAIGLGLGALLHWPLAQGLFFGGVISVSSTAVILKTLLDRGEVASRHGRTLLSMLVTQDLLVVILIVVLPQLTASSSQNALGALAGALLKTILFIGVTIFLGERVAPALMARVERFRVSELFMLAAVALALGVAMVSAALGLSPALGAFLGGLMLAETEFDHRVIADVAPMRNLFATLFFVSVGMLIDVRFVGQRLAVVVALALFIMFAKVVATLAALLPFRLSAKTTIFTSLGMIQFGEFSYVLAQTGQSVGAIDAELYALLLAASVVTIVLTPGAFWLAPRADALLRRFPEAQRWMSGESRVWAEQEEARDHVIIAGYGRVGRHVADALHGQGMPITIIEDDLTVAQSPRARGLRVIIGDASNPRILNAARPDTAQGLIACLPDSGTTRALIANARLMNSSLTILARVSHRVDEPPLQRLGVQVVMPEYAGAERLLELSQRAFGLPDAPEASETLETPETRSS